MNATKPSYHRRNLRQAVIDVGMKALEEHGPGGIRLRDIARRANVSASAIYRHFPDKESLVAAIAAECADRLLLMIERASASRTGDELSRLHALSGAYVEWATRHPHYFRLLAVPGVVLRLPRELTERVAVVHDWLKTELAAAQHTGVLAKTPLDELVLAFRALAHGLAHFIVAGDLGNVSATRARALTATAIGVIGKPTASRR